MRSGRFQNTGTSTACPSANSVSVLSLARSLRDGTTVDAMIAGKAGLSRAPSVKEKLMPGTYRLLILDGARNSFETKAKLFFEIVLTLPLCINGAIDQPRRPP
jgi:hypothetical protein